VNNTLDQLTQNQSSLKVAAAARDSTAPYEDTRDQLLAKLSKDLPIKVFPDGNNGIVVTTDQGTTLFDGQPHDLSFTATPTIPSNMRVTADPTNGYIGGLSSVTVDGQPIAMSQNGSIAANLQLRDVTLPGFADQLDQVAGGLIGTFQNADPSVSAGQTGLFAAGGAALDTTNQAGVAGLAGTIAVNTSVDPTQDGQTWRIRDGAQATVQGATSDNSTILGFIKALQTPQSYGATAGLPTSAALGDAAAQMAGAQQSTLSNWASLNTSRTQQAQDAQTALMNQTGVSIDDQMQRLMIVQQSYAASAQVIQAASNMLNNLIQAIQQRRTARMLDRIAMFAGSTERNYMIQSMQTQLNQLTNEISSGQKADPAASMGTSAALLYQLHLQADDQNVLQTSVTMASQRLDTIQTVLTRIGSTAQTMFTTSLSTASSTGSGPSIVAGQAKDALAQILGQLNTTSAGSAVFAGDSSAPPMQTSNAQAVLSTQ
jgi:flagellar basal body rod protein FlgB